MSRPREESRALVPAAPRDALVRRRPEAETARSEEIARLYADIEQFSEPSQCFIVGVTSAVHGEGKTTVAMDLAGTIAASSPHRVVLIDCSLRGTDVQDRMRLGPCAGLVDLLEGGVQEPETILQRTTLENFFVIPTGRPAANPLKIARSSRLSDLITGLRKTNNIIVIDTPPVLPTADTLLLSRHTDALVMVVRAGSTPREATARAMDTLGRDRIIGVALNGARPVLPAWLSRFFT